VTRAPASSDAAEAPEAPAPVFVVKFKPRRGTDGVRALRWVLKSALRQHGLVCLEARTEADGTGSGDVTTVGKP
jgi:hypothetical protein